MYLRPIIRSHWALVLLLLLCGCDAFDKLRGFFHPDKVTPESPASAEITVEPPDKISVFIDGTQVARMSPHRIDDLSAGEHTLEIRANGYHTFILPFKAYAGEHIKIPVQLRKKARADSRPQPIAKSPTQAGTSLRLILEPAVPIVLNGSPLNGSNLLLTEAEGHLTAGSILLHYKRAKSGLYEFVLPGDGATWARNGKVVDSASRFTLGGKEIQLYRVGNDDRKQLLVMQSGQ